jgi:hypothetical protein
MSDDPIAFITDEMIEEGEFALSAAGRDMESGELVTLIFMAMLSTMEGGKVLFGVDENDDFFSRYQRPKSQ